MARNIDNKGSVTIKTILITFVLFSIVLTSFIGVFGDLAGTYTGGGSGMEYDQSELGNTSEELRENASGIAEKTREGLGLTQQNETDQGLIGSALEGTVIGGIASIIGSIWGTVTNLITVPNLLGDIVGIVTTQLGMGEASGLIVKSIKAIIGAIILIIALRFLVGNSRTGE